ncbi:MAG: hypothetical protein BGO05_05320 [Rhizobiales bacterium 63-7]|nr:hypothetical protein [Hyphomicrobiales bacterium]OJU66624.1 MAG: hypothetical protein BGO05_05320 [Rhizobiales bacterium 63-7]
MASLNIMTHEIQSAFEESDAFWQRTLELEFGNDAAPSRYEPRGRCAGGISIRKAHDALDLARAVFASAEF